MPWEPKDALTHKRGLSEKQQRQWAAVANAALRKCQAEGGDNCDASAIRQANAAVGAPRSDSMTTTVIRYDANTFPEKAQVTREGFLRVDAPITRMGVLPYRGPDGSVHGELRHPDDWGNAAATESLRSLPITDGHPPPRPSDGQRLVDATNAKELAVGWTGDVRADGAELRSPITVMDGAAVKAIQRGRRGTSTGVEVELVDESGVYNGEPYQFRQVNPRGNHIAIVDSPRAGTMIRLDDDGNQLMEEERTVEKRIATIVLDGISYEAAPEVVNALTKTQAEVATLRGRIDSTTVELKAAADTFKAERDAFAARVDELEKRDLAKEIADGVRARVALHDKARAALPKAQHEKLDSMSDDEVRRAVIAAALPSFTLEGRSDAEVKVAFEIAAGGQVQRTDAISEQRRVSTPRNDGSTESPVEAAARAAEERISNQWKPKAA